MDLVDHLDVNKITTTTVIIQILSGNWMTFENGILSHLLLDSQSHYLSISLFIYSIDYCDWF